MEDYLETLIKQSNRDDEDIQELLDTYVKYLLSVTTNYRYNYPYYHLLVFKSKGKVILKDIPTVVLLKHLYSLIRRIKLQLTSSQRVIYKNHPYFKLEEQIINFYEKRTMLDTERDARLENATLYLQKIDNINFVKTSMFIASAIALCSALFFNFNLSSIIVFTLIMLCFNVVVYSVSLQKIDIEVNQYKTLTDTYINNLPTIEIDQRLVSI